MHLATYLVLLASAEDSLAGSHRLVAAGHEAEADVYYMCRRFAEQCDAHHRAVAPALEAYHHDPDAEPERPRPHPLTSARGGGVGLLRDLQDLYQLANLVDATWIVVGQAAAGARDRALLDVTTACRPDIESQLAWLRMRMKAAAPQALLVAT